jgi:hypothetical protein
MPLISGQLGDEEMGISRINLEGMGILTNGKIK